MAVRRLVWFALLCAMMGATLAARGGGPATFDWRPSTHSGRPDPADGSRSLTVDRESSRRVEGRYIRPPCVASWSNIAGLLARRAFQGPGAALISTTVGAAPDVHHTLLAQLRLEPTREPQRTLANKNFAHSRVTRGLAIFSRQPTTCVTLHDIARGRCLANQQTPGPGDLIDRVLAVVEGQVIMLSDVRAFLDLRLIEPPDATDPIPPVLTALIDRQLILEELTRYVLEESPPVEVDARLAELVARVGGPEAFEHLLPTVGFAVDDLRQVLRDDLRIERYLARRFPSARPPTEDEVAAYVRDHAVEFPSGDVPQSFDAARRRLSEVLRQDLIDDWIARLTARGDVFRVAP